MNSQKFITSISTIPNQSRLYHPKTYLNYSSTDIRLPIPQTLPLKFPKKNIRKQTQTTMLTQTNQNPQKSCIRNFNHANRSRVFDQPDKQKRIARDGLFHSLSKQSPITLPLNRSMEDFGAPNNRKKFIQARHIKPDPIVIGQHNNQHNSALQKVWGQQRRHRDNGKFCEQTLNWPTNKTKSYLQRYREQNKYKNSQKVALTKSILI